MDKTNFIGELHVQSLGSLLNYLYILFSLVVLIVKLFIYKAPTLVLTAYQQYAYISCLTVTIMMLYEVLLDHVSIVSDKRELLLSSLLISERYLLVLSSFIPLIGFFINQNTDERLYFVLSFLLLLYVTHRRMRESKSQILNPYRISISFVFPGN